MIGGFIQQQDRSLLGQGSGQIDPLQLSAGEFRNLFFGKETKGLPETLLYNNPDTCVRMPMLNNERARSLNLSNTVAIATYEVLRQWGFPELLCEGQLHELKWDD